MDHTVDRSPTQKLLIDFPQRDDSSLFLCVTLPLMPALLPAGDESAMNLEAVGGFLRHFCFPQHFCMWGVSFVENVASSSIATEQAACDRTFELGLRGSHNRSSANYQNLKY
jgi:hypothetical protein